MNGSRPDARKPDQLRKIELVTGYTKWAEGSVLCSFGDTRVLCNASIEDRVPPWMKDQKRGWVTAEYSMLPRATDRRTQRESVQGKIGGRTHEISRLIGRAIRAGAHLPVLGERTVTIDCDVIQADGGTRTASITGAWVATWIACQKLVKSGAIPSHPLRGHIAAVSLGVVGGQVVLDLSYKEDQEAETDLNLVMTGEGGIVEIQGTAERAPFSKAELDRMVELGFKGITELVRHQRAAIDGSELVLASSNRKKAEEIRALLGGAVRVETLADHPEIGEIAEVHDTFEGNAIVKAEEVARALGRPALADDSGLVVDALGGAPGVRSARYAPGTDRDRYEKLLAALAGAPDRAARFVCVMALAAPGRATITVRGVCEGSITRAPRGESGFGYDPVFLVEGRDRTMAELTMEEKNAVSHRGRALAAMLPHLRAVLGSEP